MSLTSVKPRMSCKASPAVNLKSVTRVTDYKWAKTPHEDTDTETADLPFPATDSSSGSRGGAGPPLPLLKLVKGGSGMGEVMFVY